MRKLAPLGAALLLAVITACQTSVPAARPQAGAIAAASALRFPATVAVGEPIPDSVVASTLSAAQAAADEASRRRQIDFFKLHPEAVGMRLGAGADAGWVLSYLGTSTEREDLNIELRAFYAGGKTGFHFNYSGPVTLSAEAPAPMAAARGPGVWFELLFGLPGNGVIEAYGDFMDHLGDRLVRQYQARPMAFDDGPIVFAVHEGEGVVGFLFTNQGNRLVLGDRKYADVQSVVMVSAEAEISAAYTLVGFNPKTAGAGPIYRLETDERLGTIAEFGEY